MDEVAIFGGAFDPISIHHEEIAKATGMPTWIMPCYKHLFNKNSRLIDSSHRLQMVKLVESDQLKACDWEVVNKHSGSMYETLTQLKKQYPSLIFHIVLGMDNANLVKEKWHCGEKLIQENKFIIFTRKGYEPSVDWISDHKILEPKHDLSSTMIRNAINNKNYKFAQEHLNPLVWDYICQNKLYGYES